MRYAKLIIALSVMLLGLLASCGGSVKSKTIADKKVLVVYFSATGTTQKVAEQIAQAIGADIMAIEPDQPYTAADLDWTDKHSRCCAENDNPDARPAVKNPSVDISDYDTIILGYPIWWDACPRVVNTFIESNNLKGKTVMPFATSGGSGVDNSVADLKNHYPDITWTEGRLFNELTVAAIHDWLPE